MIQKKSKYFKRKNVKITKQEHAFKGFQSTFNVEILNSFNSELQLKDSEYTIKSKLVELLTQLKGFKFATTLVLVFKKIERKDKTRYDNFYSTLEAEIVINESDIDDVFQSIYTTIITNIQKSLGKGSVWTIDSVIDITISISKYNPLAGSSYINCHCCLHAFIAEEILKRHIKKLILMVNNMLNSKIMKEK